MPRYFLHVRDGVDNVLDPEGFDYPDLEAAWKSAVASARELLAADMMLGRIDLRHWIDVEDEAGEVVLTLPFRDAFTCVPADPDLTRGAAATA